MKRYYLAPIVGNGSRENPYRAKVQDYGVTHVAVVPTDPLTGIPLFSWALVLVSAPNHSTLLTDLDLTALPDFPLDAVLSALQAGVRNAMLTALANRGVDIGPINTNWGYRQVIRHVGQHLDGNFSENNFDVSD